uniref:Ig-like domain-containing protein n=1 Tax=Panagrolaimus sp. ES5 TaxID=591445 RepID=A0AC34GF82_9BILA
LNGSDENTVVRCLPYKPNRDARTLDDEVVEVAPQFIEEPADYKSRIGDEIRLRCSAVGPPMPQIFFEKDGKIIESTKKSNGETEIRKTINSTADFGEYNCIAINSVGESRVIAKVTQNDAPQNLPIDDAEHQLTIVNCTKNGTSQSDHAVWKIGNELVDHLDDSTHAMNNGSLVLSYFAMEDDLDRINCFVDGEPGDAFQLSYITINDVVPVVKIKPVKIYSHPTQDVIIDCWLKRGNPLTTRVRWSKDNVNVAADGDKIRVLPNNSLLISNSVHTDRGNYKCRAWNSRGKSWDGVD